MNTQSELRLLMETHAALQFAAEAHRGQLDKQGVPFIEHPIAVARNVVYYFGRPALVPAAYLHDVVEDTGYTLRDLTVDGFSGRTVALVDYMTRRVGERYFDYIRRVATSYDASVIKRADIYHNTDPSRRISDSLTNRYAKALTMLPLYRS